MKPNLQVSVLPTRSRLAALTMAALMLATTLVITAPAVEAQDTVPTRPTVTFEPIPNLRQFLYPRFDDLNVQGAADAPQPDCSNAATAAHLRLAPAQQDALRSRGACSFPVGTGIAGGTVPGGLPSNVDFTTLTAQNPNRRVSVTGNTGFAYHHVGTVPDGSSLTITLKSNQQTVATATIVGDDDASSFDPQMTLAGPNAITGRVFLEANTTITLSIASSSTDGGSPVPNVGNPATWTIDDTASYLEIRADDAIRAAIWITDEKDQIKSVFSPIANDSQALGDRDRRVVGHFALQSAFGLDDASGAAPQFSILLDGRPVEIASGNRTILNGEPNASATVAALGVKVWSFPANTVNYRGLRSGEYTLHVEKSHSQGAPINRQVDKKFSITAQSVRLFPYSDARFPSVAETQAHAVQPGSSTTYILAVNNTGSVNDTFTINVSAPNTPTGWGVVIGGPDVLSRSIFVPSGQTRVFTITVNAPFTATGEVIHLVNVTSTLDPGARSVDLTLVSTVRGDLVREVGIIFLGRDLTLEPGVEANFPVYVWNRGTRTMNASLEIQESGIAGWSADLAFGNAKVDRVVLSSIRPGDLAEATLKMTGPLSAAVPSHAITLNATHLDTSGVTADRLLTFALRAQSGVSVTVLNNVGARDHVAELSGPVNSTTGANPACNLPQNSPQRADCTLDGLDGMWYRVWVANTGRVADQFDITADTFVTNCRSADDPPVFPEGGLGGDFAFYTRSPGGVPSKTSAVQDLPAGKTAEIYVFVPVIREANSCKGGSAFETFSFVVQAKGRTTGVVGRALVEASARNGAREGGVYLEGVVREAGYSSGAPFVDTQNATKRTIVGGVEPGKNLTYFVRLTNAATWSEYTEGGLRKAPDVKVSLFGVDLERGWNVSIRPVFDAGSNDILRNPYGAQANLANVNTAVNPPRREGWFDREFEVVVQAPSVENGTALAGLRDEFQIIAESVGTDQKSTLEIATVITDMANVTGRADQVRVFAHPGQAGAFLLYVTNNGSSPADVTLRASMAEGTANGAAWQVNPNAQRFPLTAFKNRTIALLVTPPAGSSPGITGDVNVTLEYARNPLFPQATTNVSLRLTTEVVQRGTLELTPRNTDATIGPGGTANFTMTIRNSGSIATGFRIAASPIPNWSVTASPDVGPINPGESKTVVLVLIAPNDVTNESRFASVVRIEERDTQSGVLNTANFDSAAFTVNILGGKALPRIGVPNLIKRVDRAGIQHFEVQVQNVGSAAGRLALEVRSQDPSWQVGIIDAAGRNITSIQLNTNELANVNVTVRAPFSVPERVITAVEITAFSPDLTQSAKATLSAEIHDYGVQITLVPSTKDALPGLPTEFTVRLKNTGNDNDTLNLSTHLLDLPEWSVQLSSEEVRLEPGQAQEVRATIRSPTNPLPAARSYTFPFWVGTRGGQAVDLAKNQTTSAVITVLNYRAYDVDKDGQLEIAVDLDKRPANGFEEFREIFSEGITTQVVAKGMFQNRNTFFLDVPRDRPYDGVADLWFNPETVYAYEIPFTPDVNGDGTPDYFLDTDRDNKVDMAFDTATERFWDVVEVKVYDDDRIQYMIDTTGDGRPDRFFDPATSTVTRTQKADNVGADYVGIDVNDDRKVDYYYNVKTKATSGAEASNVGSFAKQYYYFFIAFAVLVLLTVILLVRRRK